MPFFRWEDIDHSLVSLKVIDLAEQMHRQIEEAERRIQIENRGNLNESAVPFLVLRMKQDIAEERARRVYEIYCNVWQTQGNVKSASFVRAVLVRAIVPLIRARTDTIEKQFSDFATRTNFPTVHRDLLLKSHRLEMNRLEGRWRRRLEAEAKECEHADRKERLASVLVATPTPHADASVTTQQISISAGEDTPSKNVDGAAKSPKKAAIVPKIIAFTKTRDGAPVPKRVFSDDQLLNTYNNMLSTMEKIRTFVLSKKGKTSTVALLRNFGQTLLGKVAAKEKWEEWLNVFPEATAKGATIVFLETATGVQRGTLESRLSRARAKRKTAE